MTNWIDLMGWAARLVLLILFMLSIWSVSIMFDRKTAFQLVVGNKSTTDQLEEAKKIMDTRNWTALQDWAVRNPSILSGTVHAALQAGNGSKSSTEAIDRAVQSYINDQRLKLEKGLNVLATLGSNAPFIGLFGTVMGIIQSFGILSSQQGSAMNAVMLGLAEALIATAVGLFVAIPAVVAYNTFGQKLKRMLVECGSLRDYYISKL
jgi:biopolymer transport protein ExbB/TolQ